MTRLKIDHSGLRLKLTLIYAASLRLSGCSSDPRDPKDISFVYRFITLKLKYEVQHVLNIGETPLCHNSCPVF